VSDRKYRQQGYRQQSSSDRREPPRPRPSPMEAAPRGSMLAKRTISRCAACGAALPVAHASLTECPNCRAALHACRQCTHFEPARRFECTQPIVARVADKNTANECDAFALRVTVERDASPDGPRPDDIRRGFNNLFKK